MAQNTQFPQGYDLPWLMQAATELDQRDDTIAQLRAERESLQQERHKLLFHQQELKADAAAMRKALLEWRDLTLESSGVYGLHLNGDPSPWQEILAGGRFERVADFDAMLMPGSGQSLLNELARVKEDRDGFKHESEMWDEHMSPFTDYEGDEAPWQTMVREFKTLRATAQRRLELLGKCEWSGDTIRGYCPICTTLVKGHHSINCPLAKELEAK